MRVYAWYSIAIEGQHKCGVLSKVFTSDDYSSGEFSHSRRFRMKKIRGSWRSVE